jgi:hypothetical protein
MSHTAAKEAGRKTIVKYEICFIFEKIQSENRLQNPQVGDNIQLRTMNESHGTEHIKKGTTYQYYLGE